MFYWRAGPQEERAECDDAGCVFLMCLMTVLWALIRVYVCVFGGQRTVDWRIFPTCACSRSGRCGRRRARDPAVSQHRHPVLTHMLYQGMFFLITPG